MHSVPDVSAPRELPTQEAQRKLSRGVPSACLAHCDRHSGALRAAVGMRRGEVHRAGCERTIDWLICGGGCERSCELSDFQNTLTGGYQSR
jgi:hypothetical protein